MCIDFVSFCRSDCLRDKLRGKTDTERDPPANSANSANTTNSTNRATDLLHMAGHLTLLLLPLHLFLLTSISHSSLIFRYLGPHPVYSATASFFHSQRFTCTSVKTTRTSHSFYLPPNHYRHSPSYPYVENVCKPSLLRWRRNQERRPDSLSLLSRMVGASPSIYPHLTQC